ncbi:MAG: DUF1761 domain-containing protein [Ignavibacteriae bacterium]|nr:DUF1761 domain-containing protein [Ignavibacteriota bacterium]
MEVNYIAVIVASISSFLIGGIWYSPLMFHTVWMEENGYSEDQLKKSNMKRIFGFSFLFTIIIAFNLAAFLGKDSGFVWGVSAGALAGIGWVATAYGITYLFERKSFKLWLINAGYHVITFMVMGGVIGIWQ